MRSSVIAGALLVLAWTGQGACAPAPAKSAPRQPEASHKPEDKAIWLKKHDRLMEAAMAEAQASLPIFWKHVTHDPEVKHALVKIGFPTTHGGVEFLWVALTGWDAKAVHGQIFNEPEDVPNVHDGQTYDLTDPTKIADWAYIKGGKSYGEFTTRVMLKFSDPAQRKEQLDSLAPTPFEPADR